jgi:hypothetical protein
MLASTAPLVEAEAGSPVSGGLEEGLQTLALFFRERAASHGFVSLLLAGSLGQGEGSVLLTAAGPQLFNDIDLVLVTERRVSPSTVLAWEREATRLVAPDSSYAGDRLSPLGLHVDLAVLSRRRLRRLPRTLFNFDLQSARVLAGADVLPEMPRFQPTEIPAREALVLLANRCLSLCESAGPPEANTALWMYYHALKAIIDSGAALLILSGCYRTPQRERLSLLEDVVRAHYPSLLARWPLLIEMTQGAVAERQQLRPDIGWEQAVVRWREARGVILQALRCSLAQVLGLSERSPWAELSGSMRQWWTSFGALGEGRHALRGGARWTAVRVVRRPRRLLAETAVHAAAPHLLLAIEPGGESPPDYCSDLALVGSYLSRLAEGPLPDGADGDWRGLRDAAVDCWKSAA